MDDCGSKCIKYLLFVFNLVFAISGICLIAIGSIVLADINQFNYFMEERIIAPPIVLIVIGCIVFVVAFLGCYGAISENATMLKAFAVLMLIICIAELAVGIAAAIFKNDFQLVLKDSLRNSMQKYDDNNSDKMAWDSLQTKLECCGIDGPLDWPRQQRPASCCHPIRLFAEPPDAYQCTSAILGDEYLYPIGCFNRLEQKARANAKILIGVGIGIALVQILGIILACWLTTTIRKE